MRIIAGERRGHKFDGPDDSRTRPTSDLVREAIFNILGESVEDRPVYDLFAGTGALGLEALSRGASFAVFVEKDRKNAALIKRNLSTLRFEDRSGLLVADAYKWAKTFELADNEPAIVFMDPPYRHFEESPARVRDALDSLVNRMPKGSTLVIECDRRQNTEILPRLDRWDIRKYGGTQVAILELIDENVDHDLS